MNDVRNHSNFTGPLFIVGMPRSGTKLLRSLLSLHSRIRIANIETEFLPYWISRWGTFGDLSDISDFRTFYRVVSKAPYFSYMNESGALIDVDTWFDCCEGFSPGEVFEALLRHDVGAERGSSIIWGDKSPTYIWQLELLKQYFPEALFVHVIRDVRDYCISINKAWGKNMVRAAQRWVDGVTAARNSGRNFPFDYLEVRYEALLEAPERELMRICDFLNVPFETGMLELTGPTENLGDAKGLKGIVRGNYGKFQGKLSPGSLRKIESIAAQTLRALGYESTYEGKQVRVPKRKMKLYQLMDGFNIVKSRIDERGLFGALAFHFRHFQHSVRSD
jgi:hypothetical protein